MPDNNPQTGLLRLNKTLKISLGILILIGFVVFIETRYGWATILSAWQSQSLATLAFALALTFVSYMVRALRVFSYFRHAFPTGLIACLKITLQHNFYNNMLPMRLGEMSFPVLLQRSFAIPYSQSIAALLWFRALDLHAIGLFAAFMLIDPHDGNWLLLGGLGVYALAPLALFVFAPLVFGKASRALPAKLSTLIDRLRSGLPRSYAAFWWSWLWTLITWLSKLAIFAWILMLFADLPLQAAWIGAIAGDLSSVLPIHGVAGAGTYEASVVGGLALFGVSADTGWKAAVNLHLFLLGSTIIAFCISFLIPRTKHA